jgi:monoamine oxidase
VDGQLRTEEMLADPKVLASLGFNGREIEFLAREPWWKLPALYHAPYVDAFPDEYRPFDAGLDHLDRMTFDELLAKDGASAGARRFFGDDHASALHVLWHAAILKLRGVPLFPTEVSHPAAPGLTDALTRRLGPRAPGLPGDRDRLEDSGSARPLPRGRPRGRWPTGLSAMSCGPWRSPGHLSGLRRGSGSEGFLTTSPRPVCAGTVLGKGVANIVLGEGTLEHVWRTADDVETSRGLLASTARGATGAEEALATFRRYYPGRAEDIEHVFVVDWASDPWAVACEPESYAPGQLARFWPKTIEPEGRVQFVGAYADNLNWGMEAAARSRVPRSTRRDHPEGSAES